MFSADTAGIALGLFLALGIFAFKTSVGIYYRLALPGTPARKTVFTLGLLAAYAVIFLLAFVLLDRIDLSFVTEPGAFLKNGALLHLVLCAGLIVWGCRLLIRPDTAAEDRITSRGWLLLAVPCPVCLSAVLLVCAFASMLFPDFVRTLRWLLPVFFLSAAVLFLGLLAVSGRLFRIRPLVLTGRLMIVIALYFLLILLVAPQFQEAGRLYAAAAAGVGTLPASWWLVCLFAAGAAAAGFIFDSTVRKRKD